MTMAITKDQLFAGQLVLNQRAKGHRAGTDAVLLVSCLPECAGNIADLGSASGVVGLRAAQMNSTAKVTLIERQVDECALAELNIAENGLAHRVALYEADIAMVGRDASLREAFDCILTNPPFYEIAKVRRSTSKGDAHVIDGKAPEKGGAMSLDLWLRNAATLLAPRGNLIMIHVASEIESILLAMSRRFGGLRLRFVHPDAEKPAIRVLISGIKGSRAPLTILPPLVLNKDGAFTEDAAGLHAGTRRILL